MELSLIEISIAMGVVALGALVQGTIGFGLAVVSAPFLYEINPAFVPGPLIVLGLAMGLLTTKRYYKHVNFGSIRHAVIGRIPGTFAGAWLLTVVSGPEMNFILGAIVLLAVAGSMSSYKITATPNSMTVAGFFSGVFGTAASIGGPPMALLLQNEEADQIRANLAAFFVIGCLMSVAVLAGSGLFDWTSLMYGLALLPAVGIGFWLAGHLSRHISQDVMRRGLLLVCSLSGTLAILSAIQK